MTRRVEAAHQKRRGEEEDDFAVTERRADESAHHGLRHQAVVQDSGGMGWDGANIGQPSPRLKPSSALGIDRPSRQPGCDAHAR